MLGAAIQAVGPRSLRPRPAFHVARVRASRAAGVLCVFLFSGLLALDDEARPRVADLSLTSLAASSRLPSHIALDICYMYMCACACSEQTRGRRSVRSVPESHDPLRANGILDGIL